MAKYLDLQLDKFYLIIQTEGNGIDLVEVLLHTENAVLLMIHDEYESTIWKKKSEVFFEIVDELSDEQVEQYDALFDDDEIGSDDIFSTEVEI